MEGRLPSRDEALALLKEYNQDEHLIQHALAVESVMRFIARARGEPEDTWGIIGLVHDLDYEKYPEEHCAKTAEILRARAWPEEAVRAVVSHGWGICSDEEPRTLLEKTLYAVDELTGLVAATALVRPSRSVFDLEPKSVLKKWKDKRFAAGVNREVIEKGAAMLGVDLAELVAQVIMGMREAAAAIGLAGTAPPRSE
ncbi:MAG TPA: HDIG domain-containing protein [Planctomycetota bacterium]|nr:HDIG domain-containing protein [Planctomycetota bacterium]OQC21927.1 MAG: tRNA 2'-O-methylase [Planctomycetes bacterium ADurb.Bin069]NMD35370.1 HDIG domain-containing protein [Planctomycetota bacterium]HNS00025.1 HDIG domain-containing protein [Planctomycetota bacterium]HNU27047.1 HDIG domain-containing protein [Planctomycetota bacterium]